MCHDLTQEYSHDHVVMSGLAEDTPPNTVANSNRDDHTWRHDHAHENGANETMTMPQMVILAYDTFSTDTTGSSPMPSIEPTIYHPGQSFKRQECRYRFPTPRPRAHC